MNIRAMWVILAVAFVAALTFFLLVLPSGNHLFTGFAGSLVLAVIVLGPFAVHETRFQKRVQKRRRRDSDY